MWTSRNLAESATWRSILAIQGAATDDHTWQYALAKLHLPQAHRLATGDKVLVAVIDSAIDAAHPEIAGRRLGLGNDLPRQGRLEEGLLSRRPRPIAPRLERRRGRRPDGRADRKGHGDFAPQIANMVNAGHARRLWSMSG